MQSSPLKPSPTMLTSIPSHLPQLSSFLPLKLSHHLGAMNHPAYPQPPNYGLYSPDLVSQYLVPKSLIADPRYLGLSAQNSAIAHLQALQASALQKQCFSNHGFHSGLFYPPHGLPPSLFVPPVNSGRVAGDFGSFDLKKSSC